MLRIGKADGIPPEYSEFMTLDGIVRRKSVDLQQRKKILEQEVQRQRSSTEAAQRVSAYSPIWTKRSVSSRTWPTGARHSNEQFLTRK